jgi:hypothetical protein
MNTCTGFIKPLGFWEMFDAKFILDVLQLAESSWSANMQG